MAKWLGRAETDLVLLDAELRTRTRRADRQRRRINQGMQPWQRWSATIDEGLEVVERIDHAPVQDIEGLATKFRAILWRIRIDEDVIMDQGLRRALQRFGRQLAQLVQR